MYETILTNIPTVAIAAVAAGLLRSVAGWFENAYKDRKIEPYEVRQLLGTIAKYFAGVTLLSLGLPVSESVAAMFGLDVISSSIKK